MKSSGFGKEAKYLEAAAYEFMGDKKSLRKIAAEGLSMKNSAEMVRKLQDINTQLQRRDIVRDIAKLDFELHDLNASALFPELSDAQAKLIEATTYASNKLKDVIPKIRSMQTEVAAPEVVPEVVPEAVPEVVPEAAPKAAPKAAPAQQVPLEVAPPEESLPEEFRELEEDIKG